MSPRFVKKKPKAADEQGSKGRRKRAGNVAESISYKALFRDGVAMNDFGTYSRTYRFGDISYQSASNEAQAAICKRMRMLYNGLTPDVCMQMTLVNRPIHDSEIGNRTFFEVRDDTTGPLAAEYNDILNAKMLEG
ncbi:MAG: VirB4-like conjugal transfer ATPase, partial [Eggerthella lenta]